MELEINKTRNLAMRMPALAVMFMLFGASVAAADELLIAATTSMADAVRELIAAYKNVYPQVKLRVVGGASGTLARQIDQGLAADVYLPADVRWAEWLVQRQPTAAHSVQPWVGNRLVVVGRGRRRPQDITELNDLRRIALAAPGSAPAGMYAREALIAAGVWDELNHRGQLVFAKDARQALLYAERGEVDAAIVYGSDALAARHVTVYFVVPAVLYPRIIYPVVLLRADAAPAAVQEFVAWLFTPEARAVLQQRGFEEVDL